ncbi:PTS lactose transporter subunit IIC [Sphingobium sp. SCG-1]|uniref:PTS sugar transporter subunit IIA n=1 Tax=Sphingobium sp. SCG-1 TaxID=2072936 RepID=UPI000CD689C5|nr:PTS sugar transporter subunit IIA [Sphingobium sp. SCG-1]AUW56921.1 PTS lactose transporter subunit IIC [Sphingobium sp. SCG-1]
MAHFDDILTSDALAIGVSVSSKKQLFQKLGEIAAANYGMAADVVFDRLTERERLGSTGFGGGIGIPHAKIPGLDRVRGIVVLLDTPLGFDAVDNAPVDVVFALLSPVDSGAEHLKTLARVSRYLRNETHISRMRGVGSREALFALLSGNEARDAA